LGDDNHAEMCVKIRIRAFDKVGYESRLLVIGISVVIGKEQGLEWWSDGVLD
jgi:hypothetical protein